MSRPIATGLGIAITLAVPAVLAINGIRAVTNDGYVHLLYAHGGVPDDRYGFTADERTRLAIVGLHSILPSTEGGFGQLEAAKLPGGAPAFNAREVAHMQDVRTLLGRAYRFQVVVVVAIAGLAVLLGFRRPTRTLVPLALVRGAMLTLLIAVGIAVLSIVSWGSFSTPFHSVLFGGDSWRFAETDTLRRLYPDRFWLDTAIVVGTLAIFQAAVLFVVARAWASHAGARSASGLRTRTQSG
jgi:integral membrane protein (TIGR01906 family)